MSRLFLLFLLSAAAALGCATPEERQAARVQRDSPAITARSAAFFKAVNDRDYAAVKAMVLPASQSSLDAAKFVEERMRLSSAAYDAVAFDPKNIAVAPIKGGAEYICSCAVRVHRKDTGETEPRIVNLYWRESGGAWYIDPSAKPDIRKPAESK